MSDALRDEYVKSLENENAELREKLRALEHRSGYYFSAPTIMALTSSEEKMLGFLMKRERATKAQLMDALYSDRVTVDEEPSLKIVDVFICKIRKKVAKFGIEIQTHWGLGYSLPPASKAIVTQMLTPERAA